MKNIQLTLVVVLLSVSFHAVAQSETALSKELIARYALDGDARDTSGNHNDGTASDTQPAADRFGRAGMALRFNGKNSFVKANVSNLPTGATPRTVSLWAKAEPLSPIQGVGLLSWGSVPRLFNIFNIGSPYVWSVGTHGGGNGIDSAVHVDEAWHHITTTYDGRTLLLFVDGRNVGRRMMAIDTASSPLFIGKPASATASHFSGVIDDVQIYRRALSAMEVKQLFESEQHSETQVAKSPLINKDVSTNAQINLGRRARIVREFPTNANIVTLSIGTGEIVAFDTNSFVLRVEDSKGTKYLPRTSYAKLGDADVIALLKHPKLYTNATQFSYGPFAFSGTDEQLKKFPFKVESAERFEKRLHDLWESGGSLGSRVTERLEIFQAMTDYNKALLGWLSNEYRGELAALKHDEALERQLNAEGRIEEAQYLRSLGVRRRYASDVEERNKATSERDGAKQQLQVRSGFISHLG